MSGQACEVTPPKISDRRGQHQASSHAPNYLILHITATWTHFRVEKPHAK
jgi:hypothetical protein